jgi:hypothetical protein
MSMVPVRKLSQQKSNIIWMNLLVMDTYVLFSKPDKTELAHCTCSRWYLHVSAGDRHFHDHRMYVYRNCKRRHHLTLLMMTADEATTKNPKVDDDKHWADQREVVQRNKEHAAVTCSRKPLERHLLRCTDGKDIRWGQDWRRSTAAYSQDRKRRLTCCCDRRLI